MKIRGYSVKGLPKFLVQSYSKIFPLGVLFANSCLTCSDYDFLIGRDLRCKYDVDYFRFLSRERISIEK